uniref:Uncharacterized protein n=1 Tax=Amphimedon queenslandica TaxID=400682 RepID=A0A1X7VD97_AMPQE
TSKELVECRLEYLNSTFIRHCCTILQPVE